MYLYGIPVLARCELGCVESSGGCVERVGGGEASLKLFSAAWSQRGQMVEERLVAFMGFAFLEAITITVHGLIADLVDVQQDHELVTL